MIKERRISETMNRWKEESLSIPAFNVSSYDAMKAISMASSELNLPTIIQLSQKVLLRNNPILLKNIFDVLKNYYGSDTYLHLDHCQNKELIKKCIYSGFDMVMYDGSSFSIEKNIQETKAIVEFAHLNGVAVEAEVGSIGGEEDGSISKNNYASLDDIQLIIEQSSVDCLAIGFGNLHGEYVTKSVLNWKILESAREITKIPFVLHGGTGLSDSEFNLAKDLGCSKINISTELKKAYKKILNNLSSSEDVFEDPSLFHNSITTEIFEIAIKYLKIFNNK